MSRYFESLINRSSVRLSGQPVKETGNPVSKGAALPSEPVDIGEHTFIESHHEQQSDQRYVNEQSNQNVDLKQSEENYFMHPNQPVEHVIADKKKESSSQKTVAENHTLSGTVSKPVDGNKTTIVNKTEKNVPSPLVNDKKRKASSDQHEQSMPSYNRSPLEQHTINEKQTKPAGPSRFVPSAKNESPSSLSTSKQGRKTDQSTGAIEEIIRKTETNQPVARSEKEVLSNYIINQVQTWVQEDSEPVPTDAPGHHRQEQVPSLEVRSSEGTKPIQQSGQERPQEAVRLIETDNQLSIGHIDITIEAPPAEKKQEHIQPVAQVPSKQESQSFLSWQRHYQTI